MSSTLIELKEAMPWIEIDPATFRFDVRIPNGNVHWFVAMGPSVWRVTCDEGKRNFPDEGAACDYFWERYRAPQQLLKPLSGDRG